MPDLKYFVGSGDLPEGYARIQDAHILAMPPNGDIRIHFQLDWYKFINPQEMGSMLYNLSACVKTPRITIGNYSEMFPPKK